MEFGSILKDIEDQKKDEAVNTKLYRYFGLIQAIEFFSNKLTFDQIIDSSFDFVNELLLVEKTAVFIKSGDSFVLRKIRGYDGSVKSIKNSNTLQDLAKYNGAILYIESGIDKIFSQDVLDAYSINAVIPLIVEFSLYGFIFISNKSSGNLNHDDYIISEVLMKLFNNALEAFKRYEDLMKSYNDLDEKIFNLFAINQSSKALLSELSLDVLYSLSVDVFSELTQSSSTGFMLYDERIEKYTLMAYKDVHSTEKYNDLILTTKKLARVDVNRILIDVRNEGDVSYFNSIFNESIDAIAELKARFIVLLLKNAKVLGFVTLGDKVTGVEYNKSVFELIESLSSSTFIAISNAQLFKQVNEQKELISRKFEKLISLNSLIRKVNSSIRVDALLDVTLQTLGKSFDVEKAFFSLYDKETNVFKVEKTIGIDIVDKKFQCNEKWKSVFNGIVYYEGKDTEYANVFGSELINCFEDISGILILPVFIERVDKELLGIIVVLKNRKTPINSDENILAYETVAGHIAPVLKNLFIIEEQQRFSLPHHIGIFKRDLRKAVLDASIKKSDLLVVRVLDNREHIFKENSLINVLKENYIRVYPFTNNNIFIILNRNEEDIEEAIKELTGVRDLKISRYLLGKQFNDYADFFDLF